VIYLLKYNKLYSLLVDNIRTFSESDLNEFFDAELKFFTCAPLDDCLREGWEVLFEVKHLTDLKETILKDYPELIL
jgi:hypothetical protein